MELDEVWKDIPGFRDVYQVSNLGRVRSKDHYVFASNGMKRIQYGRILRTAISKKGYVQVSIMIDSNKRFHTGVHRLVAKCFIPEINGKDQVNHIDGDKLNNKVDNLEWCNNSENQKHAVFNNLINHNYGENHHNSKLTYQDVNFIRTKIEQGVTQREIAKEYNISATSITQIKHNRTYKNL